MLIFFLSLHFMYLSRVLIFAVVGAPYNGLLLPHPRLGFVSVSKVLLGLQRVLQVLSPLRGFSLQRVPASMKFSQLSLYILTSKVPWIPQITMISISMWTIFNFLKVTSKT